MRTQYISDGCLKFQDALYSKLNNFSHNHSLIGRLGAIPLAVADAAIEIVNPLLSTIEALAMTVFNLLGAALSSKCTLKDAIANAEWTLIHAARTPINVLMAPIKVVYQIFAILINPANVNTINLKRVNTFG